MKKDSSNANYYTLSIAIDILLVVYIGYMFFKHQYGNMFYAIASLAIMAGLDIRKYLKSKR
jgi:hypothetical protein